MSHDSTHQLIQMANDIGQFFASDPDHEAAVDGIAKHIRMFWEPRMRRQILAHLDAGGAGLDCLPREALKTLAETESEQAGHSA